MTDAVLRRLKQKLAALEAQRSQLDEEIKSFRVVIASMEASEAENAEAPGPQASTKRGALPKELTNRIWRILSDEGRPLHYKTIYTRLKEQGVDVPGNDPAKNVGAHMSADPRFENVSRGLWGLKSWLQSGEHDRATVTSDSDSGSDESSDGQPFGARSPIPMRPLTARQGQ